MKTNLYTGHIGGERIWLYVCDCDERLTETNYDRLVLTVGTHMLSSKHCTDVSVRPAKPVEVQLGCPVTNNSCCRHGDCKNLYCCEHGDEPSIREGTSNQNVFGFCGHCRISPCICDAYEEATGERLTDLNESLSHQKG